MYKSFFLNNKQYPSGLKEALLFKFLEDKVMRLFKPCKSGGVCSTSSTELSFPLTVS